MVRARAAAGILVAGGPACSGCCSAGRRAAGRLRWCWPRRSGWQLYQPVPRWTTGCATAARAMPPDAGGVWGDVVTQVVRLHRRKRFHKQRLLRGVPRAAPLHRCACPTAWSCSTLRRRSSGSTAWPAACLGSSAVRTWASASQPGARPGVRALPGEGRIQRAAARHALRPAPELSLSFQVVPYGGGQRLMLVRDVTRQVRLEAMRKDFVANASHELRSPLTVITGYLETLEQDEQIGSRAARAARRDAPPGRAHERDRRATCWSCRAWIEPASEAVGEPVDVGALVEPAAQGRAGAAAATRTVTLKVESAAQPAGRGGGDPLRLRQPAWTTPPSTRPPEGSDRDALVDRRLGRAGISRSATPASAYPRSTCRA